MNEVYRQYLIDGEQAGLRYEIGPNRKLLLGQAGLFQGRHAGSSLEFKDHRGYEPGDDLRQIDWNAYARSDQLTVKLFHEEVCPYLDILIDASRSMDLPESAKARATLGVSAMLATAGLNSGFQVRVWMAGAGAKQLANSNSFPRIWQGVDFDFSGDAGQSYGERPPDWRPRSIRFVISDLLWNCEPLSVLSHVADNATALSVIQVLAREDNSPSPRGRLRLIDSETGLFREVQLDDVSLQHYLTALANHQQNWHNASRQVGAVLTTLIAEDFVEDWKLDELVAAEILKIA